MPIFRRTPGKALTGLQSFLEAPRDPEPSEPVSGLSALVGGLYDDELTEWTDRQLAIVHGAVFFVMTGGQGTPRPGAGAKLVIAELLAEVELQAAGESGGSPAGRRLLAPED